VIKFEPRKDCRYKHDYIKIFKAIEAGELPEAATYRTLILQDLFFIVCFVMGIEKANHPFVVKMCREVEDGPQSDTIDIWARFHFKSVIITQAETLQCVLKDQKRCNGIFAYARPLAKAFLRSIKTLCEESDLLKMAFPDVLWQNPQTQAPKWSEDDGLVFKGANSARKESNIEAWGLVEGMPTGRHFERNVFDDIETDDIKDSPDMLDKVFSKFEMSYVNLGTGSDDDIRRVIGTYYAHLGPIKRVEEMINPSNNEKIFHARIVPGSTDGTANGDPVLMEPKTWEIAKASRHFNSQQLCDPTPKGDIKLDSSMMTYIDHEFIPLDRMKFMIVDPAGDKDKQKSGRDCWAMGVFGVVPSIDEVGTSDIYIEDLIIEQMNHSGSVLTGTNMYLRNGMIQQLGIEKVGQATFDDHMAAALRAKGRHVSNDVGNMVILKPERGKGITKHTSIESAIAWPLANGKIRYSSAIPQPYIDRLKAEMDKFPLWHDDGLDLLKYLYVMLKDFRFSTDQKQKPLRQSRISVA